MWHAKGLLGRPHLDKHDLKLAQQNHNPIKLLTSSPEVRSAELWELDDHPEEFACN